MRKVFISYASQDETWVREWLIPRFATAGIESRDFRNFHIGVPKLEGLEVEIEGADYVLLVLSPNWLESEWGNLIAHMLQSEDPNNGKRKMLPLQLATCETPKYLKGFHSADFVNPENRDAEILRLMSQISGVNLAGSKRSKPDLISLSRLPDTSGLLYGREKELKLLDEAWANPKTNIVTFVAQGGEGKTALVGEWLNQIAKDDFRGAARVYGFSFYSQGSEQDRQVSGDPFLVDALTTFGDPATANSPQSAFQKAQRLAALVREQPTLLILDGIEPLQYPPLQPHHGKLRDEGVRTLLKELARVNNGLCLVSTRVWIKELDTFKTSGVIQQNLPHLSEDAGAELLEALGTSGSKPELKKVSGEYKGHALALTLLGRLLAVHLGGDIRKRDLIPALTDEDAYGGHAKRVLAYYSEMFKDKPELGILKMLGLFDRPAEESAIKILKQPPAILGITDEIVSLQDHFWNNALKHIRDLRILEESSKLDCHPLIREYFAMQVIEQHKPAWKEAHKRLYEYHKNLATNLPNTLEEMEPLYRAMNHGCKASIYQEAFDDILKKRIHRGEKAYSLHMLGTYSSDLAAIAGLFETPWQLVHRQLNANSRSYLLNAAGYCLTSLGRLREAIEPLEAGLEKRVQQGNWKSASESACNLSDLHLGLGEMTKAMQNSWDGINYANNSGDLFAKMRNRSTHARVLFLAGEMVKAEALFREAEEFQIQGQPQSPKLYSVAGFCFCDLLLEKGNWNEVEERARQTLEWSEGFGGLLSIALDHLSLGKAAYIQSISQGTKSHTAIKFHINQALDGMRKSGSMDFLPLGLLARAAFLREMKDYEASQADLDEVLEIADPEMRLHLTDYHLESARLCLAIGNKHPEAQDHYEKSKKLIEDTGYHRRDKELEDLREKLDQAVA